MTTGLPYCCVIHLATPITEEQSVRVVADMLKCFPSQPMGIYHLSSRADREWVRVTWNCGGGDHADMFTLVSFSESRPTITGSPPSIVIQCVGTLAPEQAVSAVANLVKYYPHQTMGVQHHISSSDDHIQVYIDWHCGGKEHADMFCVEDREEQRARLFALRPPGGDCATCRWLGNIALCRGCKDGHATYWKKED